MSHHWHCSIISIGFNSQGDKRWSSPHYVVHYAVTIYISLLYAYVYKIYIICYSIYIYAINNDTQSTMHSPQKTINNNCLVWHNFWKKKHRTHMAQYTFIHSLRLIFIFTWTHSEFCQLEGNLVFSCFPARTFYIRNEPL